jgi:hypothetical protein
MIDAVTRMASRLPERILVLSVAVILACQCTVSGASAVSAVTSASKTAQTLARPWHVSHAHGSRSHVLWVSVISGYCYGKPKPQIAHIEVVERGAAGGRQGRAVITVFERYPAQADAGGVCEDLGLRLEKAVHLRRPVAKLSLFDGSSRPPRLVAARR